MCGRAVYCVVGRCAACYVDILCGDRTFSYQAALRWNALPESLRTLTAVDPFLKAPLKNYLFQIANAWSCNSGLFLY